MANVVSDEVYNQLKQMYWWNASKASRAKAQLEVASAADYDKMIKQINAQYGSSTSSSTPKTTTANTSAPKSNTVTETYRWQVSDGTANMNSMSQTAAKSNSRDFQVGTWDVVDMPQQPKVSSVQQQTQDKFAKSWNSLSTAQQQAALTKKDMLDYVNSKWLTVKKEETPATTTTKPKQTTYTTPKQQEWDYQDNSQARMDEIARNLNWFRQTNPELFQDPSTFYSFFIDWKGRSQDQIDYLWNYYDRVKKYSKYDNMPASSLWEWLADGSIPQDYLDYIKWIDPQKYQEILSYKQDWEDRIKNENYLEDLSSMAWLEWWESEASSIQYGKRNWIWLDENGDWIDDRRYHAPTEEELQLSQEDSEYEAEKLKLKNAYKWLQDDLTEQYPDADLSTIMVLTSDRGTKIQKALDTISVAQTKTQWRLAYLQNERATMDKAWADSIAQLQKNLWMYYSYSPEWIAELAQAQYWATNITLDQADSWNETQKQMALQNVLDWYYAKYWDIIQRSEQQVINDVIAYAKKKWIWLAQALQENFVQPLQSKPWFAQLNSVTGNNPDVFKIWENTYWYWDDNWNLVSIWGGSYWPSWVYQFTDAEVRTWDTIWNDINSIWHILDSDDWLRVWTYTSPKWYTYNVYANREDWITATENLLRRAYYWMSLADAAQKWIWQWKDISEAKRVIQQKWLWLNDKLSDANVRKFIEAMWTWEGTLKWWQSLDDWASWGKDLSSYKQWWDTWTWWYNEWLTEIYKQWRDKPDSASAVKDFWNTYWDTITAAWVSKDDFLKQYDAWYEMETADAYLDILSHLDQLIELTWWEYDRWERWASILGAWDVGRAYEYIKNNLTVQWLRDAKQQWLKLWVLSDSDVRMIGNASTTLSWTQWQKSWNRELNSFREKLLSKNKYLRDRYQNKSAYSDNTSISFNSGDKTFTIWETITSEPTKKAKSIRDLWK